MWKSKKNTYQFFFPAFEALKSVKFPFRVGTMTNNNERARWKSGDLGCGINVQERNAYLAIFLFLNNFWGIEEENCADKNMNKNSPD